jgi:hypothetical protein
MDTDSLVVEILGKTLLAGWYPHTKNPFPEEPDSVLPRQLMTYLIAALAKLKSRYQAGEFRGEETKKAAAESYAALSADSKKRRAMRAPESTT